jgi:hypothetical protein
MRRVALIAGSLALAASIGAAHGCSSDVQTSSGTPGATSDGGATSASSAGSGGASMGGAGGASSSSSAGDGAGGAASSSGAGGSACHPVRTCSQHIYECGDGIDNDGDGLTDSDDPDCLGACDNSEDSLFPGIFTENAPGCVVDCYFDQNSGPGDDDCHWSHRCDPNEVAPDYYPEPNEGSYCEYDPNASIPGSAATCADLHDTQSDACHAYCDPVVPNGCDCFGCCELPAGGGKFVWLESTDQNYNPTCDLAHVADPTKCHPCEPVTGCMNPCDSCEICIGKPAVPAGCQPVDQCAPGVQPCGLVGEACCPAGTYCVTGCCQPVPQ